MQVNPTSRSGSVGRRALDGVLLVAVLLPTPSPEDRPRRTEISGGQTGEKHNQPPVPGRAVVEQEDDDAENDPRRPQRPRPRLRLVGKPRALQTDPVPAGLQLGERERAVLPGRDEEVLAVGRLEDLVEATAVLAARREPLPARENAVHREAVAVEVVARRVEARRSGRSRSAASPCGRALERRSTRRGCRAS